MKAITIFRHTAAEGAGYFADFLKRQNIPFHIIKLDKGEAVPSSLAETSALVFMGGPMSVSDDINWIEPELELIRQAIAIDMPVLGHCLGGQLISKALGGTIGPNPVKELGWLPVQKQHNQHANNWLSGLPANFDAFHWHGETFTIPDGATNILASQHCPNQAFVIGNTLAMQCHVEMTAEMVIDWATIHAADIAIATDSIQSYEHQVESLNEKIAVLQNHADQLYTRWLRPLVQI